MIYVTFCALLVTSVAVASASGLLRSLLRQQARERELLLNQIMHLSGKTWAPPPVETWKPPADDVERDRYVLTGSDVDEQF